jgi:predicted Zn-dependent protease
MRELDGSDKFHLNGARGWYELGNYTEANEELEQISPHLRSHPDALRVRYEIYAALKKWEMAAELAKAISALVPESAFGWIHCAYALHEMKRTKEAWDVLLPVADKFSDQWVIRYNLACYAAQLGDLTGARQWLEKTFEVADRGEIKLMALDDKDLEPLWSKIGEL